MDTERKTTEQGGVRETDTLTAVRLPGTGERILIRGPYHHTDTLTYNGDGTWSAVPPWPTWIYQVADNS